jgi:hypothetical protein
MIKRYFATKDNTITNAFEENLKTRATGSNMGASDTLEVFSIYGQASSASSEKARIIMEFDTTQISTDRSSGDLPASGSVSFYLKLSDVTHSQTVPREYVLSVNAINGSWQEGYGLDMDNYQDLTRTNIGSNWINASNIHAAATATVTVVNEGWVEVGDTISLIAADGTVVVCTMHASTTTSTAQTTAVQAARNGANTTAVAAEIATAINYSSYFAATNTDNVVNITQSSTGFGGNTAITITEGGAIGFGKTNFTGGTGQWSSEGADFYTDNSSSFTQTFTSGLEDLEVDITPLVEQWVNSAGNILGSKTNNGLMIKLSPTYEDASKSYYTKKFFGRESEFFFKRPVLEARYDDTIKDNRGRFFLKNSILSSDNDNTNTLYYYNYVRNRLRNIPGRTNHTTFVYAKFFTGSATLPGSEIKVQDSSGASMYTITGGYHDTGIYSCSVMITGSHSTIYDVWYRSTTSHVAHESFFTGSISTNTHSGLSYTNTENYVLSMPALKEEYRRGQKPKLRLYAREKNWSPNIYTLASRSSVNSLLFNSASYQVRRSIDDYVVIDYGTGSLKQTGLSYDISGNYFYLDTNTFEAGYKYDIYYSIFDEDSDTYIEQPYKFRFRVVD